MVISILEQALITEKEDTALTGFLIISLCDLGAKSSMPIIETAFLEDRVDETLVSLAEVQEHLGVPVTAEKPRWNYGPGEPTRVAPGSLPGPADDEDDEARKPFVAEERIGRNEPCPCGSGKKYKKCCGAAA